MKNTLYKKALRWALIGVTMIAVIATIYKELNNIEEYPSEKIEGEYISRNGTSVHMPDEYIKENNQKYTIKKSVNTLLSASLYIEICLATLNIIIVIQEGKNKKTT